MTSTSTGGSRGNHYGGPPGAVDTGPRGGPGPVAPSEEVAPASPERHDPAGPATRIPLPAAAGALTLAVVWLVLYLPDQGRPAQQLASVLFALGAGALAVTGGLLRQATRRQATRARLVSTLLLATGLLALAGSLATGLAFLAHDRGWAVESVLGWVSNWAWVPGQAAVMVLLLRFPSGRVGRGWRLVERVVLGWALVTVAVLATVPGPLGAEPLAPLTNPLGLGEPGAGWDIALSAVFLTMPCLLLTCVVGVVVRYLRARGPERDQLRWPALATVLLGVAAPAATLTLSAAGIVLESLAYVLLPWSVVVGVLRHRLFDVDVRRRLDRLRAAREDERRQLQHDLHDSIGPILGAISMQAEAVRHLIAAGAPPARVDAVLAGIGAQATEAASEVRRLLDDLEHGPLDEADLESTLRSRAAGLHPNAEVDCPEDLGELPRPVERAALRIASEALHNVARHAAARTCRVSLQRTDESLVVEVLDDGRGVGDTLPGIGRTSMTTRAEAVGGTLSVDGLGGGGTVVRAVLPLPSGGAR